MELNCDNSSKSIDYEFIRSGRPELDSMVYKVIDMRYDFNSMSNQTQLLSMNTAIYFNGKTQLNLKPPYLSGTIQTKNTKINQFFVAAKFKPQFDDKSDFETFLSIDYGAIEVIFNVTGIYFFYQCVCFFLDFKLCLQLLFPFLPQKLRKIAIVLRHMD